MLCSQYFLHTQQQWLQIIDWPETDCGSKDTQVESSHFRANQAAFLGSIRRGLWNRTSDNLAPEQGRSKRQNKPFHEFVTVRVKTVKAQQIWATGSRELILSTTICWNLVCTGCFGRKPCPSGGIWVLILYLIPHRLIIINIWNRKAFLLQRYAFLINF